MTRPGLYVHPSSPSPQNPQVSDEITDDMTGRSALALDHLGVGHRAVELHS
jgi:hypothetical protein